MSWRIVVISSRCKLDLKMGSLVIRGEDTKRIFLDEIAMLVVENPAVSLTGCLLEALVEKKIRVVFCDRKRSPFELNQKSLLNKVSASLEQSALSEEQYLATQTLLTEIETTIDDWAFAFPCDIVVSKLTVASLLKAVGIALREEYDGENGEMEKVLDYMELVREFDGDKLFITVNMRNWFSDEIVASFMQTALSHEYKVLMVESCAHSRFAEERRVTIDRDLCEF